MSVIEIVSLALVGLFLLVAVVRLFRKPLKLALRVVLNKCPGPGCPVAAEQHCPGDRADAGRQLVQRTDSGCSGPAGAGASAAGEVGAGVVT